MSQRLGLRQVAERWATFDCYGTLVDWNTGIHRELERLFGVERADELLVRYHELEPELQVASPGASYREVLTRALERLASETGLGLPEGETSALARSLPSWPVFDDVRSGLGEAREPRVASRHPLQHRSRPHRCVHGRDRYRIPSGDRGRGDRLVQAGEAALGGLPRGDGRRLPARARGAEPLPRHRPCLRARDPDDLDQQTGRAGGPAADA